MDLLPVRLRPLREEDLPLTLEWRNRPEIRRWFKSADVISFEKHLAWFHALQKRSDDFVFVAERIKDAAVVGQVSIYNLDPACSRAEVGRFIAAPEFVHQGYMKCACRLLIDLAFYRWGANTLYLEVFSDNAGAIRLYKSLGFIRVSTQNNLERYELTASCWRGPANSTNSQGGA